MKRINPSLETTVNVLIYTLWGECRGESFQGKRGVASVIWNRALKEIKKNSIGMIDALKQVCLAPHQFSCWNDDNASLQQEVDQSSDAWYDIMAIVTDMVSTVTLENGSFKPIFDATFYHATSCHPYWADEFIEVEQIGNHIFYKEK